MSTLELENIKHPDNSGNNIELNSNGSMVVDRQSTDGTIIDFRKSGTTVGSIGTLSSRLHIENGDTGLRIAGDLDQIFPCGSGGDDRDAAIDLGSTGVRFKDAYLSGGIYLGGTGSANKLEDYEEGSWTPNLAGSTGGNFTMGTQQGFYTKVGSVVTVYYNVQYSSTASAGGYVRLYGFPFTAKNNSGAYYYTGSTINTNGQITVSLAGNGTQAIFHTSTSGVGQVSQFNSSGDDRVNGSFSYLTDA